MTLKKVPARLHLRLKERAAQHRRSLNAEMIACLEAAVAPVRVDARQLLEQARALRARVDGVLTDGELARLKDAGRR